MPASTYPFDAAPNGVSDRQIGVTFTSNRRVTPPRSGTRQTLAPSCSCCGHHRAPSCGSKGRRYVSLRMSVSCASKDRATDRPNSGSAASTLLAPASRIAPTVPRENDMAEPNVPHHHHETVSGRRRFVTDESEEAAARVAGTPLCKVTLVDP